MPGIATSARAMHEFTDLLPLVEMWKLDEPPAPLGKDTIGAMQSGLFWGAVGGVRELIDRLSGAFATRPTIVLSGGAGRQPLIRQMLADCSGLPVLVPDDVDPVLLGSAMLAASAAGAFPDLGEAMTAMAPGAAVFTPAGGEIAEWHARRLAAFETLQVAARQARQLTHPARPQAVSETPT